MMRFVLMKGNILMQLCVSQQVGWNSRFCMNNEREHDYFGRAESN